MSAIDDFIKSLEATEVMTQVLNTMNRESAYLLKDICLYYRSNGAPAPDHRLQFAGYMGEAALKALISAGFVKKMSGGRLSLYAYEPTEKGLQQFKRLEADGYY